MKRLVFKKWVEEVLFVISFIAVLFMASDCNDLGLFILVHLIAFGVLVGNCLLLKKYGRKCDLWQS